MTFSGISRRYSWNTRKLHFALKRFPKGSDCGQVIILQLRTDRSILSYTVFNIRDFLELVIPVSADDLTKEGMIGRRKK